MLLLQWKQTEFQLALISYYKFSILVVSNAQCDSTTCVYIKEKIYILESTHT